MFVHSVYFWLNESATDSMRQQIIDDCQAYLAKIPTVRQLFVGQPAMTPRPVVDNSYHVGLCVLLDDAAAHDAYQEHPLHKQFIARNHASWKRVQVYDFK